MLPGLICLAGHAVVPCHPQLAHASQAPQSFILCEEVESQSYVPHDHVKSEVAYACKEAQET